MAQDHPNAHDGHLRDGHRRSHHHHSDHHSGHRRDGASARIGFAFWLNFIFTLIELVGGVLTNSVAIISDAVHDLGDTLAIGFGWGAAKLAERGPDARYTYGYRRLSLLSALVNGVILIVGSVWILSEALPRLWTPQLPHTGGMLGLALLGFAVNGFAAWRLSGGASQNEKVMSWHLLEDTLGWAAVLVGAAVMHFTGWALIDPLLSLGVTLFILVSVMRNLTVTVRLFLQVSPDRELTERIRSVLEALDGVSGSHHLHLWSLDGEHHVLTAHLTLASELNGAQQLQLKHEIHELLEPFALAHTTIEFELPLERCRDH
jgi:cobalt-zinc-cadmium efflux system protein